MAGSTPSERYEPGLEVVPSDAPQVAPCDTSIPIPIPPHSTDKEAYIPSDPNFDKLLLHPHPQPRKWWKRKRYWIPGALILCAVIISGAVGGILGRPKDGPNTSGSSKSEPSGEPERDFDISTLAGSGMAVMNTDPDGVFYQHPSGDIVRNKLGTPASDARAERGLYPKPKRGTPLAAVSWASGQVRRLFYVSEQDKLQVASYSSGEWNVSAVNGTSIHKMSKIAALVIEAQDTRVMHLYFQKSDGKIAEYGYNFSRPSPRWEELTTLGGAYIGTGLAAVNFGTEEKRLYIQTPEKKIAEWCWNNSWGMCRPQLGDGADEGTAIAAASWYIPKKSVTVVYSKERKLTQMKWVQDTKWVGPDNVGRGWSVEVGEALAAAVRGEKNVTLWYRRPSQGVADMLWSEGQNQWNGYVSR